MSGSTVAINHRSHAFYAAYSEILSFRRLRERHYYVVRSRLRAVGVWGDPGMVDSDPECGGLPDGGLVGVQVAGPLEGRFRT